MEDEAVINNVFENLFQPCTQDELNERFEANYRLVRQFENDIQKSLVESSDSDQGSVQSYIGTTEVIERYIKDAPDVAWYDVFSELIAESSFSSEHAMIVGYKRWKEIREIVEKVNRK